MTCPRLKEDACIHWQARDVAVPRVSEQLVDDGAALSELSHPAKTANIVQMNLYGVSGNEDCPICLEDALNCMACNLTYSDMKFSSLRRKCSRWLWFHAATPCARPAHALSRLADMYT